MDIVLIDQTQTKIAGTNNVMLVNQLTLRRADLSLDGNPFGATSVTKVGVISDSLASAGSDVSNQYLKLSLGTVSADNAGIITISAVRLTMAIAAVSAIQKSFINLANVKIASLSNLLVDGTRVSESQVKISQDNGLLSSGLKYQVSYLTTKSGQLSVTDKPSTVDTSSKLSTSLVSIAGGLKVSDSTIRIALGSVSARIKNLVTDQIIKLGISTDTLSSKLIISESASLVRVSSSGLLSKLNIANQLSKVTLASVLSSDISHQLLTGSKVSLASVVNSLWVKVSSSLGRLVSQSVSMISSSSVLDSGSKLFGYSQSMANRNLVNGTQLKVSSSDLNVIINIANNVSYTKFTDSGILTVIKLNQVIEASKAIVVVISSANLAAQLYTELSTEKTGLIDSVTQSVFTSLTEYEKFTVLDFSLLISNGCNISANAISALVDPCSGYSTDLNVVPIVDRLNKESIDFLLCGGVDRFNLETVDLLSELHKRGLI